MVGRLAFVEEQQPGRGRDWFKVAAIGTLVLGALALLAGLALVIAAFVVVGA